MASNQEKTLRDGITRLEFAAVVGSVAMVGILKKRKVYLVPNFHPASCGWLTTFSEERVYCAISYLNHLDRVRDDPEQIVMMQFENPATLPIPEPITAWNPFAPKEKLSALHAYDPNLIGHPSFGS